MCCRLNPSPRCCMCVWCTTKFRILTASQQTDVCGMNDAESNHLPPYTISATDFQPNRNCTQIPNQKKNCRGANSAVSPQCRLHTFPKVMERWEHATADTKIRRPPRRLWTPRQYNQLLSRSAWYCLPLIEADGWERLKRGGEREQETLFCVIRLRTVSLYWTGNWSKSRSTRWRQVEIEYFVGKMKIKFCLRRRKIHHALYIVCIHVMRRGFTEGSFLIRKIHCLIYKLWKFFKDDIVMLCLPEPDY